MGIGLGLAAAAFTMLAAISATGATAIVSALTIIVTGVSALIPVIAENIGRGVIAFANAIADGATSLTEAVVTVITLLVNAIIQCIPLIVNGAIQLITALIQGIADGLPGIVGAAVAVIAEFIKALGIELPKLIDAGFKMIIDFINGLAEAIRDNTPALITAAANLASAVIEGLVQGLFGGIGAAVDGIKRVGSAILNGFKDFFGIASPSKLMTKEGKYIPAGIQNGVESGQRGVVNAIVSTGKAMYDGLHGELSGVGRLATNVIGALGAGLTNGLGSSESALDGMSKALSEVANAVDGDMDLSPTIRPVIDMSLVDQGMADSFANSQTIDMSATRAKAYSIPKSSKEQAMSDPNSIQNGVVSDQPIQIINHYHVRNDSDISKINTGLNNIITKYARTRGVAVNNA
jgi:hypothetical protein